MEAALLSTLLKSLVPRLLSLAEQKYKLHKGFRDDVTFLTRELPYITEAIDGQLSGKDDPLYISIEELHQLAHDIEDCLDRIMFRVSRKKQNISVKSGKKTEKMELAKEMLRLKTHIRDALERKQKYCVPRSSTSQQSKSSTDRLVPRAEQFGLEVHLDVLLKRLAEEEPTKLKVISIVGFCGSGKTVLAHELYDSKVGKQFQERAWVYAAHKDPRELLMDILRELKKVPLVTSNVHQLSTDLREHLDNKMYFIVIDDMRKDMWGSINSAFPSDVRSRVVVTTKFQSVATACSSSANVHKIGRLDKENSKQLFLKKACPVEDIDYPQPDSAAILKKCDGQPLALTTVAEFMRKKGWPKGCDCFDVCKKVKDELKTDDTLDRLHQALIHDYTSLPTHVHKVCLLYFAMFPSDHAVRTKRLLRRWLGEGLVQPSNSGSDSAAQIFDKLMDQNIIQSIDVSNNTNVNTCKTYGMMHEYITLRSLSENVIAFLDGGKHEPKHARRLSLRDKCITDANNLEFDLSLVRSLIVIGKAGNAMLDFSKYQLLRVLDLEQCTDLENDHLKKVCNLLLLKYLSLGSNITSLPNEIVRLEHLETLDLRRTAVKILHRDVIKLPNLIHLFGKFKLQNEAVLSDLQKFLAAGKCKLQTLGGFVVDESKGFAEVMGYMNQLRKVKVWCVSSASDTNLTILREATQKFIHDVKDSADDPRSLSVHFEGCSEDFLNDLMAPCYLQSLKLQGRLLELPGFVMELRELRELCLQSTKLTADLLRALCHLKHLQYLKLIADELVQITVTNRSLPRLLRLCFVLQRPTLPIIENGASPYLESLQLLCKDLDGLSGIEIKGFTRLREVILDGDVANNSIENWLAAVKEHPNRPKLLLRRRIDREEHSAASEETKYEITECSVLSKELGPLSKEPEPLSKEPGSVHCASFNWVSHCRKRRVAFFIVICMTMILIIGASRSTR